MNFVFENLMNGIQVMFFAVFLFVVLIMVIKHIIHLHKHGWDQNWVSAYWRSKRKKK